MPGRRRPERRGPEILELGRGRADQHHAARDGARRRSGPRARRGRRASGPAEPRGGSRSDASRARGRAAERRRARAPRRAATACAAAELARASRTAHDAIRVDRHHDVARARAGFGEDLRRPAHHLELADALDLLALAERRERHLARASRWPRRGRRRPPARAAVERSMSKATARAPASNSACRHRRRSAPAATATRAARAGSAGSIATSVTSGTSGRERGRSERSRRTIASITRPLEQLDRRREYESAVTRAATATAPPAFRCQGRIPGVSAHRAPG